MAEMPRLRLACKNARSMQRLPVLRNRLKLRKRRRLRPRRVQGAEGPKPERWQTNVATFYGTMMWLWIFHRARHDGKAMLVRQAARTRSGRVRLLPGFCAQNAMLAELTCAVPLCAGSRASLGRASLTCRRPPVHCAQPPRLFARLGHGGAIDCSLCAWRVW